MTQNSDATVLVVDDFPDWRSRIREMSKPFPEWRIIAEASDGQEAVHMAAEYQPDIILLDIGLPNLNGIEAARRIRRSTPQAHIVFVTMEVDEDIKDAARSVGGTGFVGKTDAPTQLIPAIAAALADHYAAIL